MTLRMLMIWVLFALNACAAEEPAPQQGVAEKMSVPAASATKPPTQSDTKAPDIVKPTRYDIEIINRHPHAENAFTQGLFFDDGVLYESTGRYGESRLRRIDLETGKATLSTSLNRRYFGEGSVALGDEIFMLSWKSGTAFVFDKESFKEKYRHRYDGEGWGLTTDGKALIMSDGTTDLRFINPETFAEIKRVTVTANGRPLNLLNELEWINGEIYANVYRTGAIVRIDPESGAVTGIIDCRALLLEMGINKASENVLNGIAYNSITDQLYVTGKYWPTLFEIALTEHTE